jgi:Xaa-Pro dipeptidase
VDAKELDALYRTHLEELEQSYASILGRLGWDAVVLHSGSLVKRSQFDDQFWPLRPTPAFQHWLPLVEADAGVVVRPGHRTRLFRTTSETLWERPPKPESQAFEDAFEPAGGRDWRAIRDHLGPGRVAFIGEERGHGPACVDDRSQVNPIELTQALDGLRTQKTPYELGCLVEANRRASVGHETLRKAFREIEASEMDLHLSYLQATGQDDGETPYKNIVALGRNASTLHHIAYGRRPAQDGGSLLVDAGAVCRGYCADITRTWVKGRGAAATSFEALVSGVEAMQQRLCALSRVNLSFEALHDESHRQVAQVLRDAGLARGSTDEVVGAGITRAFYPHGLGHSLGLQTHDVGCALRKPRQDNPFLRNTSDIAPRQVFTIEPGVYFIPELLEALRARPEGHLVDWTTVSALSPFGGVRVEDDVYVGDSGAVRNLTREKLPAGGGRV